MQQTNDRSHRIATIPNLMSLFRLLLIPALIWLYCVKKNDAATTAVLVLSGLTEKYVEQQLERRPATLDFYDVIGRTEK